MTTVTMVTNPVLIIQDLDQTFRVVVVQFQRQIAPNFNEMNELNLSSFTIELHEYCTILC